MFSNLGKQKVKRRKVGILLEMINSIRQGSCDDLNLFWVPTNYVPVKVLRTLLISSMWAAWSQQSHRQPGLRWALSPFYVQKKTRETFGAFSAALLWMIPE
jgi:hypothetical protein